MTRTSEKPYTLNEIEVLVQRRATTDLIIHGGERRRARRDIADESFDRLVATCRALMCDAPTGCADDSDCISDECDALRMRLSDLLTRTANALKGEPKPLHSHSWHDLPEIAAATVEQAVRHGRLMKEWETACLAVTEERDNARAGIRELIAQNQFVIERLDKYEHRSQWVPEMAEKLHPDSRTFGDGIENATITITADDITRALDLRAAADIIDRSATPAGLHKDSGGGDA